MPQGEPISHAEMIAWCRDDLSWKEHHGWPDDELAKHRAVLLHLDRTQPTDTQADLTERARDIFKRATSYKDLERQFIAALQSEREAAAAEARRAAIQIARREHEEHIAARDDALAAGNEMGALTRARQAQTASEIARAIRALASPAAPQEETR